MSLTKSLKINFGFMFFGCKIIIWNINITITKEFFDSGSIPNKFFYNLFILIFSSLYNFFESKKYFFHIRPRKNFLRIKESFVD